MDLNPYMFVKKVMKGMYLQLGGWVIIHKTIQCMVTIAIEKTVAEERKLFPASPPYDHHKSNNCMAFSP